MRGLFLIPEKLSIEPLAMCQFSGHNATTQGRGFLDIIHGKWYYEGKAKGLKGANMTKTEIKSASNDVLVFEFARAYSAVIVLENTSMRGTKGRWENVKNIASELVSRELLTQEQMNELVP